MIGIFYDQMCCYIKTNEIPVDLSHENTISSNVKISEKITVAMAT